jgi:hypothetical protein
MRLAVVLRAEETVEMHVAIHMVWPCEVKMIRRVGFQHRRIRGVGGFKQGPKRAPAIPAPRQAPVLRCVSFIPRADVRHENAAPVLHDLLIVAREGAETNRIPIHERGLDAQRLAGGDFSFTAP